MANPVIGTATVLALLGEGRKTVNDLQESFGIKPSTPEATRLSVCLAHLKKRGAVVHERRGEPWALRGPAQANKSMKMRLADEVEDVYDWLASSPEPKSAPEIGEHFKWDKGRALKRLAILRRTTRVELVGGGNHRKWRARAKTKPVNPRFDKMAKVAIRDHLKGRDFRASLDDQLRARLADLDRERDAILVLLETR